MHFLGTRCRVCGQWLFHDGQELVFHICDIIWSCVLKYLHLIRRFPCLVDTQCAYISYLSCVFFFGGPFVTLWQPPPQGKFCHKYLVLLQKNCPKNQNARIFWFGRNVITFQLHQKVYCHFAIICRKHWTILLKNFSVNDTKYLGHSCL